MQARQTEGPTVLLQCRAVLIGFGFSAVRGHDAVAVLNGFGNSSLLLSITAEFTIGTRTIGFSSN